jgi:SAM-dependent methyltransferase
MKRVSVSTLAGPPRLRVGPGEAGEAPRTFLRRFFDARAAGWERDHCCARTAGHATFPVVIKALMRALQRLPHARITVLDVGCATGAHLRALSAHIHAGHGIDQSPEMIAQARDRLAQTSIANLSFAVMDVELCPPARRFELITLLGVFEHVVDKSRALQVLKTLLAEDGRIVITSTNPASFGFWRRAVARRSLTPKFCPGDTFFDPAEMRAFLSAHGFSLEAVAGLEVPALGGVRSRAPSGGAPAGAAAGSPRP